jgi:hypothetical protein
MKKTQRKISDPPIGSKFGEWTTTRLSFRRSGSTKVLILVRCSCGKESAVRYGAKVNQQDRE